MVQKLAVTEEHGLSVGCGSHVIHYGKPGTRPMWADDSWETALPDRRDDMDVETEGSDQGDEPWNLA
jgi:hypothetical protein